MWGGVGLVMLHNRDLPDWIHRLANGVIGGFLSMPASLVAVHVLDAPLGVLWVALPVVVFGMALNPRRFSLVEGCAGDLGYDELLGDGADKPDDGGRAEAFDA